MKHNQVSTANAPKAIGPYSQGIKANGFVFCSGQVPINPETGELVPGPITVQTKQVLLNLKGIIEAAGSSMDLIVKCTVYLKDMDDFSEMNAEYAKWFGEIPPARATVEVARLPRDVRIEIDAIALL